MNGNILDTDALSKQYDTQNAAYVKQYEEMRSADQAREAQQKQPPSFLQQATATVGHATLSTLDAAMSTAESYFNSDATRPIRDFAAGAIGSVVNAADTVQSLAEVPTSPIWEHAKQHILDFRDAVAVQDPTMTDKAVQAAGQFIPAFSMFSRATAGLHWAANAAISGFGADAVAGDANQHRIAQDLPRVPDIYAAGQHTQNKYIEALNQASNVPGELVNHFVNYLASTGGNEEEERFKNGIEGAITNTVATPLFHGVGVALKHSFEGLRYAMENGVGSPGSLLPANQEGKIVFHGTPHDFDEFDASKIGSGEGNQTFGHGLYFAENPETANSYRRILANRHIDTSPDSPLNFAQNVLMSGGIRGDRAEAVKEIGRRVANATDPAFRDKAQKAISLIKSGAADPKGSFMHVDIPDEHIANMIDWDKPIAEQPSLQSALKDLDVKVVPGPNRDFQVMVNGKPGPRYLTRAAAMSETDLLRSDASHGKVDAGMAYNQLAEALRSPKAASEHLAANGIPGIKYLDAGSRDTGKGTNNIVLFDAKHAKIVKKE